MRTGQEIPNGSVQVDVDIVVSEDLDGLKRKVQQTSLQRQVLGAHRNRSALLAPFVLRDGFLVSAQISQHLRNGLNHRQISVRQSHQVVFRDLRQTDLVHGIKRLFHQRVHMCE